MAPLAQESFLKKYYIYDNCGAFFTRMEMCEHHVRLLWCFVCNYFLQFGMFA